MEGSFQGDLADVVRASGGGVVAGDTIGNASCSRFPVDQQLPMHPLSISDEGFGDPFSSMRDPLLVELEGIDHGVGSSTSSSPFHGDFMAEMRDDSAAPAFQISCASDHDANASGGGINEQMRVNCDLRGLITPTATCDLREGLMNLSSPNKGSSSSFVDTSRNQISSPRNPILKRRKSQVKKVVSIPAPTTANSRQGGGEVVPSDLWAWRKYGQKPIKGSPYPRGYYRCSSSKGCSARKQVERSRTDPNMLVITYTSEHNHPWPTQRNSLAGSSRIPVAATSSSSKPSPPQTTTIKEETDPQKTRVTNKDITPSIDQSKSSVKTDRRTIEAEDNHIQNDVVLPNQTMMNELVFDYDQSYRPLIQEGESDQGFFADLRELEESDDPLNGFLFDHGNKSVLEVDPFGSLFDWSTSSNSNTTTTTNSGRQDNSS